MRSARLIIRSCRTLKGGINMKFSMSITKGLGNQKHNNRTQKETTKNVNHDLTFLNVTLLDENIRNVYHELFDPSLEKYNAKQKRSDRKIKDYYSKIANSKQEKLFHELVVSNVYHELFDPSLEKYNAKQKRSDRKIKDYYSKIANSKQEKLFHELVVSIGNIDNAIRGDIANEIYTEFLKRFSDNNPQMRVFGAYIHHDEIGTVHMHLDYVPFSVDNKRGLETRVSNDKAIEQMGYRNWTDWKDRQFETLEKICHEHNIERVNMNNHSRHISVESYKKEQRMIESLQNDLEHTLKSQDLPVVEPIKPRVNRITKKKTVPYDEYLALLEHNREQSDKINTLEKQIALQKAQICSLTDEKEKYKQIYLNTRKKSYIEENGRLEAYLERLENINNSLSYKSSAQEEKLKEAEKDRDVLKKELHEVRKENERLKISICRIKDILEDMEYILNRIISVPENILTRMYERISGIRERVSRLYPTREVKNIEDRKQAVRQKQMYNSEIDELLYETREEVKAYQTKEREKNIARQQERGMSR